MLKTIKMSTKLNEYFYFKKINNIYIFLLDYNRHTYLLKKYFDILKHYYTYTFVMFYFKIMWRGKAYRVRFFKKNSKFTLNFGYSHWYKLLFNKAEYNFGKLKRQSYIVVFYKRLDRFYLTNVINNIRVLNKYTRRGMKIRKTPYIRRFGKISQVNSSLHSY
jgi:hypothetical protein